METQAAGSEKLVKQSHGIKIYLLGIFLLLILLLIPVSVSLAQGNPAVGASSNLESLNNNSRLDQIVITDTATSTPTGTATNLPTNTPTPTATTTPTFTPSPSPTTTSTSSPSPTATSTNTGVPPTSTSTATSTLTPTVTGTPPTSTPTRTPTVTGTQQGGIPSLRVSVTPTQAKVNENFTFTIEAGNTGTETTDNNMVLDSFPTYIDVLTVTASPRGTITKLTHSFVVTIGEIAPNEKITITAVVKVNNTLSRTETVVNTVTLTYGVSRSMTASVNYRVLFTTLPPTGDLPLNWRESQVKPLDLIPGLLLIFLGMILLLIGVWSKVNNRRNTLWMISSGVILIMVGFFIGSAAMGLVSLTNAGGELTIAPTTDAGIAQVQSEENLPRLPAYAFSTPESIVPIETLPNYPIPTPVLTQTPAPGETGPDTSAIERIAIPSILVDTVVKYVPYDGFSWMISGLREEVAWMGNTSWPGIGGNTGLAGHVTVSGMGDGPFRHLDELANGEVVILYTEKNIYTYQVRENKITDDGDMSVVSATGDPQITLITCADWDDDTHSYQSRLVVVADLVRTEPITIGYHP